LFAPTTSAVIFPCGNSAYNYSPNEPLTVIFLENMQFMIFTIQARLLSHVDLYRKYFYWQLKINGRIFFFLQNRGGFPPQKKIIEKNLFYFLIQWRHLPLTININFVNAHVCGIFHFYQPRKLAEYFDNMATVR